MKVQNAKARVARSVCQVKVRIDNERVCELLDKLDKDLGLMSADRRTEDRLIYRHTCLIELTQPTGDVVSLRAPTRNLSRGGIAFLHHSFIHTGTTCGIHLVNLRNRISHVEGVVTRCVYVEDGIHHVSVRFAQSIDPSAFCSPTQQQRVLIVDDDPQIRRLVQLHLKQTGAEVHEAENGEAAVRLLETGAFDLVLMDVEMPVMDGIAATKALRERGDACRIVALTAMTAEGDRDRILDAGFDDYLAKPVSREGLQELLDRMRDQPLFSTLDETEGAAELIEQFVSELGKIVSEIEQAVNQHDTNSLGRLCRSLKGSAGSYGFEPISRVAQQIEVQAAQGGQASALGRSMRQLGRLCRLVHKSSQPS